MSNVKQLISYIAPAAPATRRPAHGKLPYLRPEMGFTPNWYHQALNIDFGKQWHTDPLYRANSIKAMREELKKRFAGTTIGRINEPDGPTDILTGTFGACSIAAIYNVPILYSCNNWPNCAHQYLNDEQIDSLTPPDLDANPFFNKFMDQLDLIASSQGRIEGFINWQGVLNNAQRLRGEQLFYDLFDNPSRVEHLFDCVCTTMIDAARRLHERQKASGVTVDFFTVSNCLVNMISPELYHDLLLNFDKRIANAFGCIGIHNCAWKADPYLNDYSSIPSIGYIDMGIESDFIKAKKLFPDTRRAVMYTPMDLANKEIDVIHNDIERIAKQYGSCDIVVADIEANTPDNKVIDFINICHMISNNIESL